MEKVSLPIETKIAAKWMKIVGIVLLIISMIYFILDFLILAATGMTMNASRLPSGWLKAFALFLPPLAFVFAGQAYAPYFTGNGDFRFAVIGSSFIAGILLIIFSQFIFRKKRLAWIFSVVLLFLSWFLSLNLLFFGGVLLRAIIGPRVVVNWEGILEVFPACLLNWLFGFILYIIPVILLLLDRKNFWKIAT